MTTNTRLQAYVFGALIVLLALIVYWRMSPAATPASPAQAGAASQPSNQTARTGARQDLPVTGVNLEALKAQESELAASDRNPFRFQPKAPPPLPARPVVERAPETFVPPPVPIGPPPPPPIPLKYVGLLGAASQASRVAVLSDARGTPFYGREGDIIEGRYRVLRIAADSVDVAYADGRGQQTLRMTPSPQ